ncbi:MAG: hypothetical protein WD317_04950 [Balneolaceae bacterium]
MTDIKRGFMALVFGGLLFAACDQPVDPAAESGQEYNLYDGLEQVEGTENSEVTVRQGEDAWFEFDIDNIESNEYIIPGTYEGWCIEWNKHIAQNGDTHENLPMYSTYGVDRWKPLNYFLNIIDQLKEESPELTNKELQAVIWSIMEGPKFDLNELPVNHLPHRLRSDGEINFDKDMVLRIIDHVREHASAFRYDRSKKFALFIKNRDDQDIMVPVNPKDPEPQPQTVSHGFVEGVTPSDDPQFAERTYPVIQADWEGPGGDKRWLGRNLGATEAPSSMADDNPESAGWYFQFNRMQGYYHDGDNRIPDTPWESPLEEDSNWIIEHDPCRELLGNSWRIPNREEWEAFHASAPLVDGEPDRDHPFTSELSLHRSGFILSDELISTFSDGVYWSSSASDDDLAWALTFGDTFYHVALITKDVGASIRCIED